MSKVFVDQAQASLTWERLKEHSWKADVHLSRVKGHSTRAKAHSLGILCRHSNNSLGTFRWFPKFIVNSLGLYWVCRTHFITCYSQVIIWWVFSPLERLIGHSSLSHGRFTCHSLLITQVGLLATHHSLLSLTTNHSFSLLATHHLVGALLTSCLSFGGRRPCVSSTIGKFLYTSRLAVENFDCLATKNFVRNSSRKILLVVKYAHKFCIRFTVNKNYLISNGYSVKKSAGKGPIFPQPVFLLHFHVLQPRNEYFGFSATIR